MYIQNKLAIKEYIVRQMRICRQLKHWNYLTADEQEKFKSAEKYFTVDNLMTTARKRAYDSELSRLT